MNLPLDKFNKDDVYTFIGGFFTSSGWYLYFDDIRLPSESLADPRLTFAWLFGTGIVFILHTVLYHFVALDCESKRRKENDEDELRKMGLPKYLSFFWSGVVVK